MNKLNNNAGKLLTTKTMSDGYLVEHGGFQMVIEKRDGEWFMNADAAFNDLEEGHRAKNFEYAYAFKKKDLVRLATYLLCQDSFTGPHSATYVYSFCYS